MKRPARSDWVPLVHVLALFSLAVSYPLLELLGRSPEFFVAHRLEGLDLAVFVLVVAGVAPVAGVFAVWLAGRLGDAPMAWLTGAARSLLAAAVMLQAVRHLPAPGYVLVLGALAAGLAVDLGCRRAPPVRLFVTLLSPAFVVAPLLFAGWSPASRLLRPGGDGFFAGDGPRAKVPIVFVLFDQLPLASLMDENGELDREAYPNFAALADTSIWFRHTTSVSDRTEFALPAVLTGRYPRRGRVPTAADQPDNLFTGLAPAYDLHVREPMTRLCPPPLCPDETPLARRVAAAGADASVAYLHRLLPPDLAASLPDVTHDWRGFWHAQVQDRFRQENRQDRRPLDWVEEIGPAGDRPALHFAHVVLPHEPFIYLPSGQLSTTFLHVPGLGPGETWIADEWVVASSYQRHLLQLGAADQFLGRLLERLRQVGLFDKALVVVAADHGASFVPGQRFKQPDRRNAADVMSVPFLLKLPGQRAPRVSDRVAETIDILPTIADALRMKLPGEHHGRSALDERAEPKKEVRIYYAAATRRIRANPGQIAEATLASARRKVAIFGRGPAWDPDMNSWREMVGRPVASFRLLPEADVMTEVERPRLYRSVQPDGPFVPAFITGRAYRAGGEIDRHLLAVAVNGIVRGTSSIYPSATGKREGRWSVMVRPECFRQGVNEVLLYEVGSEGAPRHFVLRRTSGPGGGM